MLMLLVGPLGKKVTKGIQAASSEVQNARDARAKLVAELIPAAKALKMLRWEEWAYEQMMRHRDVELRAQRRRQLLSLLNWFCGEATPLVITSVTIVGYAILSGQRFDSCDSIYYARLAEHTFDAIAKDPDCSTSWRGLCCERRTGAEVLASARDG